jgi:cytochrome P450
VSQSHRTALDPFSPEWGQCPFEHLDQVRAESPVCQVEDLPFFLVVGHPEVLRVLKDPEVFSSSTEGFGPAFVAIEMAPTEADVKAIAEAGYGAPVALFQELVHQDPPIHTRQRRLVNRWFTPKAVEDRWKPLIVQQATSLIAAIDPRSVEFMEALAVPLPIRVIGSILGIPVEKQVDFKRWSDAYCRTGHPRAPSESWLLKASTAAEMEDFFTAELEERLRHPAGDLMSELVLSTREGPDSETGDEPLSWAEVIDLVYQLLVAGNETTTQLLGETAIMLMDHPENWDRLKEDRTLIPNAVEEALRWASPVVGMLHFCRKDTEISGTLIPAGSIVGVTFGGANHDPAVFPEPDEYIIERSNAQKHVAFGHGIHTCLGAPLARAEARVALELMVDQLPGPPRLQAGQVIERSAANYSLRGLTRLPLVFGPR